MLTNIELISTFYTAFKNKDYQTMQGCYADNATFSDPVFTNLNAQEVKAMWEMLIKRGRDLDLNFSNVESIGDTGSAYWVATYTFSSTNKRVENRIRASFEFKDGKIVKHIDDFSFYRWSRQALGTIGWLLGWTGFLKNKVQKQARKGLTQFMQNLP